MRFAVHLAPIPPVINVILKKGGEMEEVVMAGMAMEAEVAEVAEETVAVARVEVAMAREKRGSVVGMAMA